MILKYDIDISKETIVENLKRLTNQVYKLLPNWEEAIDWKRPLTTIIEELAGMDRLFMYKQEVFFSLLCKLEGLYLFKDESEFFIFRKTIFECLNLIGELIRYVTE